MSECGASDVAITVVFAVILPALVRFSTREIWTEESAMTDYKGFRITEIHAITGIGEDDEEGIPALTTDNGMIPLIASDRVRLAQLTEMAQQIADKSGQTFKIVRFSVREDVGEIRSKKLA